MSDKRSLFDREYGLRIGLICLIGLSVVITAWTYSFKTDIILSIDEDNVKMFDDRFAQLAEVSDAVDTGMDISMMGQRKIDVENIDRTQHDVGKRVFSNLPSVPDDWGAVRYAFMNGKYYILSSIDSGYYLQPEFYEDWSSQGLAYHRSSGFGCNAGFFATPSSQKIYTQAGASIDTYVLVRSSFCMPRKQSLRLKAMYPERGVTDDGLEFSQNPLIVERNIRVTFDPDGFVLGRAYPVFDNNWVNKVKVRINVNDNIQPGLYVVSLTSDEYKPWILASKDVDYDSYRSKSGQAIVNILLAVD